MIKTIGQLADEIIKLVPAPSMNLVIQIQSYGRVFVYDQLGHVRSADDAYCQFSKQEDLEDRIRLALANYLDLTKEKYPNGVEAKNMIREAYVKLLINDFQNNGEPLKTMTQMIREGWKGYDNYSFDELEEAVLDAYGHLRKLDDEGEEEEDGAFLNRLVGEYT